MHGRLLEFLALTALTLVSALAGVPARADGFIVEGFDAQGVKRYVVDANMNNLFGQDILVDRCRQLGNSQCRFLSRFVGTCVAVARAGTNGEVFFYKGDTAEQATSGALQTCQRTATNCATPGAACDAVTDAIRREREAALRQAADAVARQAAETEAKRKARDLELMSAEAAARVATAKAKSQQPDATDYELVDKQRAAEGRPRTYPRVMTYIRPPAPDFIQGTIGAILGLLWCFAVNAGYGLTEDERRVGYIRALLAGISLALCTSIGGQGPLLLPQLFPAGLLAAIGEPFEDLGLFAKSLIVFPLTLFGFGLAFLSFYGAYRGLVGLFRHFLAFGRGTIFLCSRHPAERVIAPALRSARPIDGKQLVASTAGGQRMALRSKGVRWFQMMRGRQIAAHTQAAAAETEAERDIHLAAHRLEIARGEEEAAREALKEVKREARERKKKQ